MEAADTQPVVNWMMANFGLCQQPSWSIVLVNLQAVKQTEGTERLGEGRVVSALASIQGLSLSRLRGPAAASQWTFTLTLNDKGKQMRSLFLCVLKRISFP